MGLVNWSRRKEVRSGLGPSGEGLTTTPAKIFGLGQWGRRAESQVEGDGKVWVSFWPSICSTEGYRRLAARRDGGEGGGGKKPDPLNPREAGLGPTGWMGLGKADWLSESRPEQGSARRLSPVASIHQMNDSTARGLGLGSLAETVELGEKKAQGGGEGRGVRELAGLRVGRRWSRGRVWWVSAATDGERGRRSFDWRRGESSADVTVGRGCEMTVCGGREIGEGKLRE